MRKRKSSTDRKAPYWICKRVEQTHINQQPCVHELNICGCDLYQMNEWMFPSNAVSFVRRYNLDLVHFTIEFVKKNFFFLDA